VTTAWIPEGWDEGVIALGGHILQSTAWARVQERLGNRVVVGAHRDWCWLGIVRRAGPFRYLYLPFGPSLRHAVALQDAVGSARDRAHRLGCAFVRFEPGLVDADVIARTGATKVKARQYEHTLVLRLDVDEATLRRGLKSGHRSSINAAAKRELIVEHSNDAARMPEFLRMLRETEKRAGFFSYEDPYFEAIAEELLPDGIATLYFAMAEGRWVTSAMVFDFGDTRYYAYGAADSTARKRTPATWLVWRTMLDARELGRTRYDFWGAAPPGAGPDHPWSGITYFKQAFGSEPVRYAGTWELVVRPMAARLFALAHRIGR
jgi:peptidoglycan pentaglycine glycine transferase (the first glycine)